MMKRIQKVLCFLLIAICLISTIPTAYAVKETLAMWDMNTIESENYVFTENFTDAFGNTYPGAVCFDVALGSGATYDLSGAYRKFTGTLTTSEDTNSDASFDFAIVLDGKIAYSRTDFTKHSAPETVEVNLTGVQTMQIVTDTNCGYRAFLFLADGAFCRAEQPVKPNIPRLYTLRDVVLVDSSSYTQKFLARDSFQNIHANSCLIGHWDTAYAVFSLNRDYDTFFATISPAANLNPNIVRACSIYCDNQLVAHYDNIDRQAEPIAIEIDVRNVSVLKFDIGGYTTSAWNNTGSVLIGDAYLTPHLHIPGAILEDVAPTCTEEGWKNYICTVCGESCAEEIFPALGHTPGEWVTESETSCAKPGRRVKYCQVCESVVETEEIAQLPHTPSQQWSIVTETSCYQNGVEVLRCQVCSNQIDTQSIPMAEHQMGKWDKVSGGIWNAPIHRERDCEICGMTEDAYLYTFAWVKPLVLGMVLAVTMTVAWCYISASIICGSAIKKHGFMSVLRTALKLKEEDIKTAAGNLRREFADSANHEDRNP